MIAIDQSLTSSGYAFKDEAGILNIGRILPKNLRGAQRLDFIDRTFTNLVNLSGADTVVMEGYSMGSRGRVFDIGELGGVIKLTALREGKTVLIVPPSVLKKFTTGKGNADKAAMVKAVNQKWDCEVKSNDIADAVALYHFGEFYFEQVDRRRKSTQAKALLSKCILEGA